MNKYFSLHINFNELKQRKVIYIIKNNLLVVNITYVNKCRLYRCGKYKFVKKLYHLPTRIVRCLNIHRAKDAGITIMNEVGVDPGIDHLLAMECFDDVKDHGGKVMRTESLVVSSLFITSPMPNYVHNDVPKRCYKCDYTVHRPSPHNSLQNKILCAYNIELRLIIGFINISLVQKQSNIQNIPV